MIKRIWQPLICLLCISITLILSACSGSQPTSSDVSLRIFAAASLTESFNEIKTVYEQKYSDVTITYQFAGSQSLLQQIIQGAQADIFASADQATMQKALDAGLVADSKIFARNKLVLIVPTSNPGGIETLKDLSKPALKIDVAAETVPVGNYTLQVFDKLEAAPEYGSEYIQQVKANIISQENNVKAVVQKVQLGEVDAGFVYLTDITASVSSQVKKIDIPDNFNVIVEYPITLVKDSPSSNEAQRFIDFILSTEGQAVLSKYHFLNSK